MKKIIIFVFILFSIYSQAQLEVAAYDFKNGDTLEGWTIIDNNSSAASTWSITNDAYSELMGTDAIKVLSLKSLGGASSGDEWAILPVQDLSFYEGIHLDLTYLKGLFELETDAKILLYAYVSEEVPTIENFMTTEPVATIVLPGMDNDPSEEVPVVTDIPELYNVENVHFAIVYRRTVGEEAPGNAIEFTKVAITADELVVGMDDFARHTSTIIMQNPVAEMLQFKLGNSVTADTLQLQIYNLNGTLVKNIKYNENGISVSDLSGGIYFVLLNDGKAQEQLKFIKK